MSINSSGFKGELQGDLIRGKQCAINLCGSGGGGWLSTTSAIEARA
jgi:hypothetical protein